MKMSPKKNKNLKSSTTLCLGVLAAPPHWVQMQKGKNHALLCYPFFDSLLCQSFWEIVLKFLKLQSFIF